MDRIDSLARKVFKYKNGLRPAQRRAMDAVLAGENVFVILATGGGKSVCYQLPSLMVTGTVVVFSPLVALMKDQADKLEKWGVKSARLTSDMDDYYVRKTLRSIASLNILYVAPERLKSADFVERLATSNIAFVAVDEAHCVSTWAQNFRPAFSLIGKTIQRVFPSVPIMALTATADPFVEKDVAKSLGLREYTRVFVPPERKNLNFTVVREMEPERIAGYVAKKHRESGSGSAIIYDTSRARVEQMNAFLRERWVESEAYHAGLPDDDRTRIQEAFMGDDIRVMSATNAFGMGIDKADVRTVFHASVPRSIVDYVQEAGRASRDGKPAQCILNITKKGIRSQRFFLRTQNPPFSAFEAVWNDVIAKHPVRTRFTLSTYDVRKALYTCGLSSFDVPFTVESVLGYMEYRGLLMRKTEKTVHTFLVVDRGAILSVWRRKYPTNVRLVVGSDKVRVTLLPTDTDFTPKMVGDRAVERLPNGSPTVYYRAMRRSEDLTIDPDELEEKREHDLAKFRDMLAFAEAPDKHRFIRQYFGVKDDSPSR